MPFKRLSKRTQNQPSKPSVNKQYQQYDFGKGIKSPFQRSQKCKNELQITNSILPVINIALGKLEKQKTKKNTNVIQIYRRITI